MGPRENKNQVLQADGTIDTLQQREKSMSSDFCQYCEYRETCRDRS